MSANNEVVIQNLKVQDHYQVFIRDVDTGRVTHHTQRLTIEQSLESAQELVDEHGVEYGIRYEAD